jgi:hypothetical protein
VQPHNESDGAVRPVTEAVEEAMAATDDLAAVPLADHVARFDTVHSALNDALSRIDTD